MLDKVYSYLDGELDERKCADIRQHLGECHPCLEEYGLEQVIKQLIAKHCGCDQASADLRAKVLSRIDQVRTELTR